MLNAQIIQSLFADAYYEAARAGAYMRTATELLEGLRALFDTEQNKYIVWRQVERALGQTLDNPSLFGAIQILKKGFITIVYQQGKETLQAAFAESESKGWTQWLQAFADGLMEWKDEIFAALPTENFPFAAERKETLDLIKKTLPYIAEERWAESHALFAHLAKQEILSTDVRVKLWATTGQIQLYHFLEHEKALADFEQAKTLASDNSRVERSFGEYYLRNKDIEKARQHFQKALQLDAEESENYHYMGDTYSEEDKLLVAAEWYRDALRKHPGNPDTYSRLITLTSKPAYFKEHAPEIPDWVAKIERLEAQRAVGAYIDAGFAFQKNEQFEAAEKWFQKAIALDPNRLLGHLNIGYLYRDWKKITEAEQAFYKVIELDAHNFDAFWELGWLYQSAEQWEKALEAFKKSLPLRPEWNKYVLDAIGEIQEKLGHQEEAEESLLESLKLNPNDNNTTDALHKLADTWKLTDDWYRSIQLMQKMRDLKGENYEAEFHNRIGILYYERQEYDSAIEHYQKALNIRPEDAIQNENIGLAYEAIGRWKEAETAYSKAVSVAPEDPIRHNRLGVFYYNQKEYDRAILFYETAIRLQPDNAIYHNNLALAQEYGGHTTQAEISYLKAIELQPENAGYYNDLGVYYHNRGSYDKAIKYYKKAIELQPDFALYHSNLGFTYEALGDTEQALQAYSQATNFDVAQAGKLAKLQFQLGNFQEAENYARKALQTATDNGLAYDYLAQALEKQGKLAEAEAILKEAIEKSETSRDIFYNNLGLFYYNRGRYEDAVIYYKKAIELRSDYALYHDNVGLAHELLKKWEEAAAAFIESERLDPENPTASNRLGTFYYRQNQFEEAKFYYNKTVEQNPTDPIAWENLGLTYEQLQQIPEAEQAFRKALEASATDKDLYYNRLGILFYRQDRNNEAVDYYQQAIDLAPKAIYFENIGLVYERLGPSENAKNAYEKALSLATDFDRDNFLNRLGVFYYNLQQHEKAIDYYTQAIAVAPQGVYYENLGLSHNALGHVAAAIDAYTKAVQLNPTNVTSYNTIGYLSFQNNDLSGALFFYQEALKITPKVATAHENVGIILEKLGQFPAAEQAYQDAIEVAFDNEKHIYYNRLGVFYYTQSRMNEAIDNYTVAIKGNAKSNVYYENIALAFDQLYQLPAAEQAYLQALDLSEEKDYYYTRLGNLSLKSNDDARALEYFEAAVAFNPNQAVYYDNLGFVFERQQAWDKAIIAYERAIQLHPENPIYYDQIGGVLLAAQRFAEAMPWFEKAIRLNPINPVHFNNLLRAIESLSDKKIAIPILQGLLGVPAINQPLIQQTLDDLQNDLSDTEPNPIS